MTHTVTAPLPNPGTAHRTDRSCDLRFVAAHKRRRWLASLTIRYDSRTFVFAVPRGHVCWGHTMPGTLKKLAIASAASVAIIGASLTVPTTADARDGWLRDGWFGFGYPYMGWTPAYGYYDRYPYVYGADYGAADSRNPCVRWVPGGL